MLGSAWFTSQWQQRGGGWLDGIGTNVVAIGGNGKGKGQEIAFPPYGVRRDQEAWLGCDPDFLRCRGDSKEVLLRDC